MALNVQVVVGSTRAGRAADLVVPWLTSRAAAHPALDVEVLDLRDWPLPMFQEPTTALMAPEGPRWSDPLVGRWNATIARADGYVFVTPEYNHSVSGVLKNAIDSVIMTQAFRNKPAAMVGYSGGIVGGARAVEHLAHIAVEAEMVPLRNTVLVAQVHLAFGPDHEPTSVDSDVALEIMLDDLVWWGEALRVARASGELAPARARRARLLAQRSGPST